ncbi:MAG TPA: hypothetical protein PKA27_07025 [Fimbriimonadaceae bacterium]|nr:hypothetical protein [Fimbriimonadaceae bacterium]
MLTENEQSPNAPEGGQTEGQREGQWQEPPAKNATAEGITQGPEETKPAPEGGEVPIGPGPGDAPRDEAEPSHPVCVDTPDHADSNLLAPYILVGAGDERFEGNGGRLAEEGALLPCVPVAYKEGHVDCVAFVNHAVCTVHLKNVPTSPAEGKTHLLWQ